MELFGQIGYSLADQRIGVFSLQGKDMFYFQVSNMYRYTVRTQLYYIIMCYTTYQLHASATLLGHHQVVFSLQSNCITYQYI